MSKPPSVKPTAMPMIVGVGMVLREFSDVDSRSSGLGVCDAMGIKVREVDSASVVGDEVGWSWAKKFAVEGVGSAVDDADSSSAVSHIT